MSGNGNKTGRAAKETDEIVSVNVIRNVTENENMTETAEKEINNVNANENLIDCEIGRDEELIEVVKGARGIKKKR